MAAFAFAVAFAGSVLLFAECSHFVHHEEPSGAIEEAQLAYEFFGKVSALNFNHPVRELPLVQLHNARPVVVFKMDRTGSSWFADQLKLVGAWPKVKPEATNDHEFCRHEASPKGDKCKKLVHDVMGYLQPKYGGITVNPFKLSCTNPENNNTCYDMLIDNLGQMQPFAIALVRKNVVLQAASHLRAKAINEMGLCNHGFHVSRCSEEAQNYRATVEPAMLLSVAIKGKEQARELKDMARRLAPEPYGSLELTTEEFFNSTTRSFVIPDKVWHYFGLDIDSPLWKRPEGSPLEDDDTAGQAGANVSGEVLLAPQEPDVPVYAAKVATDDSMAGADPVWAQIEEIRASLNTLSESVAIDSKGEVRAADDTRSGAAADRNGEGKELLRNYITNFEAVRAYFEQHAPHMMEFVMLTDEDV